MLQAMERESLEWMDRLDGEKKEQWYFRIRDELIRRMGARCEMCGTEGIKNPTPTTRYSKKSLEIDHKNGHPSYKLAAITKTERAHRWLREFLLGRLRVLCNSCNSAEWSR